MNNSKEFTDKLLSEVRAEIASKNNKSTSEELTSKEERMFAMARSSYSESTNFLKSYKLQDFVDAYKMYNSQHTRYTKFFEDDVAGKKYNHSKFFIPKIYEFVTTQQSYVKTSLLNNLDNVINFSPFNDYDKIAEIQADYYKTLLNYRLAEDNWFYKYVLASYQDGHINNFITTKIYYDFDKKKPVCVQIPVERIRVHPKANPFAIVEDSPYVINILPMFGWQIKDRMKNDDPEYRWNKVTDEDLVRSIHHFENDVAQARDNHRSSPSGELEGGLSIKDNILYYVHENFIRDEKTGEDCCFYTLGTSKLLSKIYPTKDLFPLGRPFVIGHVMIEANKVYPQSPVIHAKPLQEMLNELQNISIDIKRKTSMPLYTAIKRNVTDLYALASAKPGSIVRVTDHNDIQVLQTPTQVNNLQEEINLAATHLDDMLGKFGISTAQSGAGANNSVGGIQAQSSAAGLVSELYLGTFTETSLEPSMRMYMNYEVYYNDITNSEDNLVKTIFKDYGVADRNGVAEEDIPTVLANMKDKTIRFSINAGQGSANPDLQFQKVIAVLKNMSELAATPNPNLPLKINELVKYQLSMLGIKNPSKFIENNENNPIIMQLQQENAQLKQQMQTTEFNPEYIAAEIRNKNADAMAKEIAAELSKAKIPGEIALTEAEVKLILAKVMGEGVKTSFAGIQAAAVAAQQEEILPLADNIINTAPHQYQNSQEPIIPAPIPDVPQEPVEIAKNNDPMTPASPFKGENQGIETMDTGDSL